MSELNSCYVNVICLHTILAAAFPTWLRRCGNKWAPPGVSQFLPRWAAPLSAGSFNLPAKSLEIPSSLARKKKFRKA